MRAIMVGNGGEMQWKDSRPSRQAHASAATIVPIFFE